MAAIKPPEYPRTLREVAQSGISRVGQTVENVLERIEPHLFDKIEDIHHDDSSQFLLSQQHKAKYATPTNSDLLNATALIFVLVTALVFVISIFIVRKCKCFLVFLSSWLSVSPLQK